MNNLPFIEKYRPHTLEDVIMPELLRKKFNKIIENQDIENMIIVGSSGIGKSAIVKIIANGIYKQYYRDAVLQLGLMEDRGIKFMQNSVGQYCKTKISYTKKDEKKFPKYKLIIFDESDDMVSREQDIISNVMDSYKEQIRFIFTCNSASNINESIQSKCSILHIPTLSENNIINRLEFICNNEEIKYDLDSLKLISSRSLGDIRSAIHKLEFISKLNKEINESNIQNLFNIPQEIVIKNLFNHIIEKNLKGSIKIVTNLKQNSYSGSDITLSMLHVIKMCNFIPENIKIKLANEICKGIHNISNVCDSDLQLISCITNMILCL